MIPFLPRPSNATRITDNATIYYRRMGGVGVEVHSKRKDFEDHSNHHLLLFILSHQHSSFFSPLNLPLSLPLALNMQHPTTRVDRKLLQTSLPDRVAFARDFVGFSDEDGETLNAAAALVGPLVKGVVDGVYGESFLNPFFLGEDEARQMEGNRVASSPSLPLLPRR